MKYMLIGIHGPSTVSLTAIRVLYNPGLYNREISWSSSPVLLLSYAQYSARYFLHLAALHTSVQSDFLSIVPFCLPVSSHIFSPSHYRGHSIQPEFFYILLFPVPLCTTFSLHLTIMCSSVSSQIFSPFFSPSCCFLHLSPARFPSSCV